MGTRGPAPKPTALRVLHGTADPEAVKTEPQPREGTPQPPKWMPRKTKAVWNRTVAELAPMRVLTPADADALAVYCQAVVHHEEAVRLVQQDGMMVQGRAGEMVRNPAMQFVRDQATLVKVLAREFGLTPAARVGLTSNTAADVDDATRLLS